LHDSSRREAILNYLQEHRSRTESLAVFVAPVELLEIPTTAAAFEMLLIAVARSGLQVRPNRISSVFLAQKESLDVPFAP